MPRSRLPLLVVAVIAVLAVGGFLVFQGFLAGDDVARLTLPPVATTAPATSAANSSGPAGSAAASGSAGPGTASTPAALTGTWSIADGSVVGYRVREQLGGVSALTDAVGRTSAVTGSATVEASDATVRVTAAAFEADVTQLQSDRSMRDRRLHTMGIESDTYPSATFTLTDPLDVPAVALAGSAVDVALTGDLTIHGVSRNVTITGQAQMSAGRIAVAASLTFPFSDFGMTPPNIAGFVSVQNDATLEVLLSLAKS